MGEVLLWKISGEVRETDFNPSGEKRDSSLGLPHPRNIFITTFVTQRKSTVTSLLTLTLDRCCMCSTTAKCVPSRAVFGCWVG